MVKICEPSIKTSSNLDETYYLNLNYQQFYHFKKPEVTEDAKNKGIIRT